MRTMMLLSTASHRRSIISPLSLFLSHFQIAYVNVINVFQIWKQGNLTLDDRLVGSMVVILAIFLFWTNIY